MRIEGGAGTARALGAFLGRLGGLCWTRPKTVILLWAAALLMAGSIQSRLSERLLSGSGQIRGSTSSRVDDLLRSDFGGKDAQSLILTFRSARLDESTGELTNLRAQLKEQLAERLTIATATSDDEIGDARLSPKRGTGHFILLDLTTKDLLATEQEVPRIRVALAPVLEAAKSRHADLDWAITGPAALTYDINRFNAEDTGHSEVRALPLTVAILIFAFGSLVAALLPLVLAVVTRTAALGIVFLLAGSVQVSNLVLSIVTMLGISLGIDYSLFLIHRYRRELAQCSADIAGARDSHAPELAMRRAMAQSGEAVVYSAATVAIGMGALLATPLMQTRSIGVGGVLAVSVALLASLTLVPAFVRLFGTRMFEWPRFISRRMSGEHSRRIWAQWAATVTCRPLGAIAVSVAILAGLAAPALQTRFGFPESEFLPTELEYSRGMKMLGDMELKGLVSPIVVVLSDKAHGTALTPERISFLEQFVSQLEQDRRVRLVLGPVGPVRPAAVAPTFEEALGGALSRNAFISHDQTRLLFQIIPSDRSSLAGLRDLAAEIPGRTQVKGLIPEVGGQAQYYNDFEAAVWQSYPLTITLVLGMSGVVLLLFFRAPLASAKAIVLNLLSVASGYGIVVLVFQLGHGAELFGLRGGTAVVPITVPLVIFCILFGLSMDYEIFLLSRVRTAFMQTGNPDSSIRDALADTGSVITSAALVMVAVFGAFAFARIVIVQMIGLGLAVAVLVDATVIRSMLGPALMQVAGRWNWWPGKPPRRIRRR